MADYVAKQHHSFDIGVITITPSEGSLVGSRAVMRIGTFGKPGCPDVLKLLLDSTTPPDAPALFSWEQEDETEVWNLRVRLSKALVNTVGVGAHTYELSVVDSSSQPIWVEAGTIRVAAALPEA